MSSVNWEQLKSQLGQDLGTAMQGIVEGAVEDIQAFANQIASEMVVALQSNDQDAMRELKAQLGVITEINRVRVANAQGAMLMRVINLAIMAATSGLVSAGAELVKPTGN